MFPDDAHLRRVRTALWSGRGKASVMVGAGFSRNAVCKSLSVPSFPTWSELTGKMVRALYAPSSAGSREYKDALQSAQSISGSLRLAEEYQAAFGRDALESFILSAVPDALYEPSSLHILLMQLPWADVLTTNYGTLLERAAGSVANRKYDVVRTIEDIPNSSNSRIVKLHGSFPSHRPFILTEEDFRTYPRRFAAFVNLAQQVAMETVLCLFGFSGDDPNFLYWAGWVRDNLGKAAPKIYLCGLLDLTSAKRNMLHDRNVVPVDLSPLFPKDVWNDSAARHAKATEWLLLNLEAGQPPSLLRWPEPALRSRSKPSSDNLPALMCEAEPWLVKEESWSSEKLTPKDRAEVLASDWQSNRKLFPGWIVLPRRNRDCLFRNTRHWLVELQPHLSTLPMAVRLSFLFELVWRLERCLLPLINHLEKDVETLLEEINPFPGTVGFNATALSPLSPNGAAIDWSIARDAWKYLALALLRAAREEREDELFHKWLERLRALERQQRDLHSPTNYEECLFRLEHFEIDKLKSTLNSWVTDQDDPFWSLKRAALYAEIAESEEATRLAESALQLIRAKMQPGDINIHMLSREGWAMMVVRAIKSSLSWPNFEGAPDYAERMERLTSYRCNPEVDLELLEAELEAPPPTKPAKETEVFGIDGIIRRSAHIQFSEGNEDRIQAFQAFRLIEDAAYLPYCGNITVSRALLIRASGWVARASAIWQLRGMIRAGDRKALAEFLNLHRVALLSIKEVIELQQIADRALSYGATAFASAKGDQSQAKYTAAMSWTELALCLKSALLHRLADDELIKEIDLAIGIYKESHIAEVFALVEPFGTYFRSILLRVPPRLITTRVRELVGLPLPGADGFNVVDGDRWPEPILEWDRKLPTGIRPDGDHIWDEVILRLLSVVEHNRGTARHRAVARLAILHGSKILNSDESKRFATALWKNLNPSTGMPADTGFYDFTFLTLPEPSPGVASEAIRRRYANIELDPIIEKVKLPDGRDGEQFKMGIRSGWLFDVVRKATRLTSASRFHSYENGVVWTENELRSIWASVWHWWEQEGRKLLTHPRISEDNILKGSVVERVTSMLKLLAAVIVPRLANDYRVVDGIRDILTAMENASIDVSSIYPEYLYLCPEKLEGIAAFLRRALISNSKQRVDDSLRAILQWLRYSRDGALPAPPADLIHEIGNIVSARRRPGLLQALRVSWQLLDECPSAADEEFQRSICRGLEYLINETEYRQNPEDWSSGFPHAEAPWLRMLSAQLAVALQGKMSSSAPVVKSWIQVAENDPLSIVRRALEPPV